MMVVLFFARRAHVILIAAAMTVVLFIVVAVILFRDPPQRPSGLIQAGNSKTKCLYVELGAALRQVEQATGINYNCIETFSNVTRPGLTG